MRFGLFFLMLFFMFSNALSSELVISAAMGMRDIAVEFGKRFEKATGNKVLFNFSSSGKLAKQIESGAPVDIYISASKFWMDYLVDKGVVDRESVVPFASTRLTLVAPKNSSLTTVMQAERIAVGDRFAPVGKYTMEVFKTLGVYEKLKGRFVFAPTVRQITIWVVTGNVDAGVIYYSDYLRFKGSLKLVEVFPDDLHSPIKFYVGVVKSSDKKKISVEFEKFLQLCDAKLFEKFGFVKIGEGND